jgi:hypothetical protein
MGSWEPSAYELRQGQPQRWKASPRRWRVFFAIVMRVNWHLEEQME